ncbi:hypothetical protein QFZ81_000157 [Paenibacillus sp. V4I9]|uniref:hypothetical protein n=1 Tax=Paenibacillus sp. V4I9 TaxID=3042308 RepID=UPI002785ECB5|nr:hypothetical protein [Paenibacillus sp. V4I9]MDQ0885069.1 hypothetical protein [Paenibacillus sp. V4I9]
MSQIKIDLDVATSLSKDIDPNLLKISNINGGLTSLGTRIDSGVSARRNIGSRINKALISVHELESRLKELQVFMKQSINCYAVAEQNLAKKALSISNIAKPSDIKSQNANAANGNTWFKEVNDFLTNDEVGLYKDVLEKSALFGFSKYFHLPSFKIDGRYVKVINSPYYKGGEGLARRYTLDNIKANRYPNATKLFNVSEKLKKVEKFGKGISYVSMAAVAIEELTDDKAPIERKISNAAVAVGEVLVAAKAGAMIGGAIGSVIPGAGTAVGAVAGAAIAVGATYIVDKLLKWEVWNGKNGEKKSTLDVTKDVVGDVVTGASRWIGGLFNRKPVTGAAIVT